MESKILRLCILTPFFPAPLMPETLPVIKRLEVTKSSSEKGSGVMVADDKMTSGSIGYI